VTGLDFGRATQARFLMDAHAHGLLVSLPFDSFPGYDALVDTGKRIYRVQVKGARPAANLSRSIYRINIDRHLRRSKPSRRFDILAVWLDGDAKWVLIPAKNTRARQIWIRPNGRLQRFAGNWGIFS